MPDIHDLLRAGAGDPLAPLDLDRAVRRGEQRTRNRRLVQASVAGGLVVVAAVAGLSLAGGGSPKASSQQPGATTRLLPDDSVPAPGPSADPRLQPVPAAQPSELPDGFNFVLVKRVDGRSLVVDKVTRTTNVTKQAKCAQAQDETYTRAEVFSFCWSNQNLTLRTVPLADAVTTLPYQPDGDPRTELPLADLQVQLDRPGSTLATQVFLVLVSHGTVESVSLAGNV